MTAWARRAYRSWPALAAGLSLALAPAPASAQLADRPNRLFLDAEAAVAAVKEPPHLGLGGRGSLGLDRGRVRWLGLVEALGAPVGGVSGDARLGTALLFGAGVGYAPGSWGTVYGALIAGNEVIALRDHLHGGRTQSRGYAGAVGGRVGVSSRPPPRGGVSLRPILGIAFTALWVDRASDPLTGASWGGFTPMLTLSVGAELRFPAFGRRPRAPGEGDAAPGTASAPER